MDTPTWSLVFAPIPVRRRKSGETGYEWARLTWKELPAPITVAVGKGGVLETSVALGVVARDLEKEEVPGDSGGLEFVLRAGGTGLQAPSLEGALRLPWDPQDHGFIESWERALLRYGLPVPVAPDPGLSHVVRVPPGLLSCVRILLEATLRASEGRAEDLRASVSLLLEAPEAASYLRHLIDPGLAPEDPLLDPGLSVSQENLCTLAVAVTSREGNISGFLSMVHRGACRYTSHPTRNRRLLAWGWFTHLALTLTTETPRKRCLRCGAPVPEGRRGYCSDRCSDTARKARYRARLCS